jgi:hypothetical protein
MLETKLLSRFVTLIRYILVTCEMEIEVYGLQNHKPSEVKT